MSFEYEFAEKYLAEKHGIEIIALDILKDDGNVFSSAIYQPTATIVASDAKIAHADVALSEKKAGLFLKVAAEKQYSLAITPEYSTPWETIKKIGTDYSPNQGAIWIVGGESITLTELQQVKSDLGVQVIFQEEGLTTTGSFLDPVCFIFWTKKSDGSEPAKLTMLVQFKTQQMSDAKSNLERKNLVKGNKIYVFGKTSGILLYTIVCSDSLDFSDKILKDNPYVPIIMIHIQLCFNPNHSNFKSYRNSFFGNQAGNRVLICANWAKTTKISKVDLAATDNFGRSGIFLKLKMDVAHNKVLKNHVKGSYYTYCKDLYAHYLVLNYEEGIYVLKMSKAGTAGVVGSGGSYMFPELETVLEWNASGAFAVVDKRNDGYVQSWEQQDVPITREAGKMDAIKKEILINRCAGFISKNNSLQDIKSFRLDETENLMRLTFTHDMSDIARMFRQKLSADFNRFISEVLVAGAHFPGHMNYLKHPLELGFWGNYEEFNVCDQSEQPLMACYIGTITSAEDIEVAFKDLKKNYKGTDINRVVVFYHEGIALKCKFEVNLQITKVLNRPGPSILEI